MAAAGTPQAYLAQMRPNASSMRDMSMDQNYTNTGNPGGYVPQRQPQVYASQPQSWNQYMPQFGNYTSTPGVYNMNGGGGVPQGLNRYTPPMETGPGGSFFPGKGDYVLPQMYGQYGQNNYAMPLPTFGGNQYNGIYNSVMNSPAMQGLQQRFMNFMPQLNQAQQSAAQAGQPGMASAAYSGAGNPQPAPQPTFVNPTNNNFLTTPTAAAPATTPNQGPQGGRFAMPTFSGSSPAGARAPVRLF